jgi:hypothetical protein
MSNILRRIEDVEKAVKPSNDEIVTFVASGTEKERAEQFKKQEADYLAGGGNPKALFVLITDYR